MVNAACTDQYTRALSFSTVSTLQLETCQCSAASAPAVATSTTAHFELCCRLEVVWNSGRTQTIHTWPKSNHCGQCTGCTV